ncbi:hypothetical protein TanjilG_04350 [Lupinus angustifolius]|uniref:RING-type domain-containing protein n=1 Tax=Lupinus angustifolius TaxID=3871 RepID=A0A4P1RQB0_LUPAN|nr:hypothetical protein TanjilG_04350 [Lupinus angustifolius]
MSSSSRSCCSYRIAIPGSSTEDEASESSSSFSTSSLNFSSGNPTIEETRGIMHLFRHDPNSSVSSSPPPPPPLPVERKPLVCVVGVPNHMTYADFCQFSGSFIHHILEMRIVRLDGMEDYYSVLIRFNDQDSTDSFYKHYNGHRFSSLEVEVCRVLFTLDVQYTGSIEHAQPSNTISTEQPTCPVCLERLDQDTGGILTTICNHSFHCSCISKWADSSCPVCRYCQQQAEKSICFVCQTTENLWICVICGFVGCGRLIQSKTDGKLVELNSHCVHADNGCGSCSCEDNGMSEAILSSKVEAIVNEYNELLASQLESQKAYFESLLEEVKEETEQEISVAVEKALSLKKPKIQAKIDRANKEKKFLDDLNENLVKNEEIWKAKDKKALKLADNRVAGLEEQLRDLMACLEGSEKVQQLQGTDEIKDGTVFDIPRESSSASASEPGRKA